MLDTLTVIAVIAVSVVPLLAVVALFEWVHLLEGRLRQGASPPGESSAAEAQP